jgi:diguanylate cyclase (GGDEF)-like protein
MKLDVPTLAFVTSLIFSTQTIAVFVQYRVNKTYSGLGWWLAGAICQAVGFLLMLTLNVRSIWMLSILGNPLVFCGQMFLFVGIRKFLGKKGNEWPALVLLAIFTASYLYFVVLDNSIFGRSLVVGGSAVVTSMLIAFTIFRAEKRHFPGSANFTACVFLAYGCLQTMMTAVTLSLPRLLFYQDFGETPIRTIAFIIPIVGSMLWTFGFIIMVNQRLNAKNLEEKGKIQELAHQLEIERNAAQLNAVTDSLTGLSNRRYLDESLRTEFHRLKRSGAPLSLIMMDVDHFKNFNDTYGHLAGDNCLRQLGAVLRTVVGRLHDIVARYGGEEFVVIMPETEKHGAEILAERIRKGVEELAIPHSASDAANHVTVSLGVVTAYAADLAEPESLVALADEALYAAKQGGRNRVETAGSHPENLTGSIS